MPTVELTVEQLKVLRFAASYLAADVEGVDPASHTFLGPGVTDQHREKLAELADDARDALG